MEYSSLQKKGFEIAKRQEQLPLADRLGVIARTFGCKTATVETSPCTGKWRGTSDVSLRLDNGSSLFIGNRRTPSAKQKGVVNELVNAALARYNPKTVWEAKERAAAALLKREAEDNAVAAQMGLKPYTFLTVELNNGADTNSGGYLGWYYVTLAVEDSIFAFIETGLNYDIARGELSERISRPEYFVAGGIHNKEEDFVFNNVGHSSYNGSHQVSFSDDTRARAEKTLHGRIRADSGGILANRHPYLAQKLNREYAPQEHPAHTELRPAERMFFMEMNHLITGMDSYAFAHWKDFANMQAHMGKQPAAQTFSELSEAFASVKRQHGGEVAARTFNMGTDICLQPSQIPAAAGYLKSGLTVSQIENLITHGEFEKSPDAQTTHPALPAKKPSLLRQLAEAKKAVAEINRAGGKEAADRKRQGEAI